MSFISDKLYNGYLRRKMPVIVSKVKVREIIIHLPCLTDHDKDTIEAKRESCGNYDGMVLLLDCLKRRENWPEQFIEALEACEQTAIAAEIRAEYNALRGINNPNPSSPPTSVITAHVHPAPSASELSVPGSGGNSQAAVAPPAEASARPEPPAQASPPLETPVQPPAVQVPKAASPPQPIPGPPQSPETAVAPPPSTPPLSSEIPHPQATTPLAPQRKIDAHQEPEENSESDIQDVPDYKGVIPDQVSPGNNKVPVNSVATLEPCETEAPSSTDPLQTTSTIEIRAPQSLSPTQIKSDDERSPYPTLTPEKPPVQDTAPPVDKALAAVLHPEETSEPPSIQVIESIPQTESTAPTSTLPDAAGIETPPYDESSMCLSKPGQLISVQPQNYANPTIPVSSPPVEPYSGNSERLEFSVSAAPDTVTSAHVPACSSVSSNTVNTVSGMPYEENGITLERNTPEENHYDSPCQSLGMQDVQVNVIHVAEEPSILNLEGQSSTPQVNCEAPKEITSAPPATTTDTISSLNSSSYENYHPSAPVPAEKKTLQDSEAKMSPCTLPANTKYILTAAGVGACALLIAWRFKN
ncbi:hypothetical protein PAMA_004211 [Pampus argenteus]